MQGTFSSRDIEEGLRRINSVLCRVHGRGAHRFVTQANDRAVVHTQMQSLFNLRFERQLDKVLYEIIVNHAAVAEKQGPGGFNRFLELLWTNPVRPGVFSHHASREELSCIVREHAMRGGSRTAAMVDEALQLAGFAGRIIVEKTTATVPSVELVRGYTFELQQILPVDVSFNNPRITCIDGYIEQVAEIHHLLEGAAAAKEPCVLFVRGVSDEVKHTLKVNYDRGSLRIVPISVRFDLEGMNTLVDLSIVSGCNLISSLKGDLISNIKFEELPYVDQVTVFKGRVVMTGSKTSARVSSHVHQLRSRRSEEKIDDVGRLLDKRIRSLTPNHVVVRLLDDKDFITSSQAIDYALRAAKTAVDHGLDEAGRLVATELAAWHQATQCMRVLSDLGAYISG